MKTINGISQRQFAVLCGSNWHAIMKLVADGRLRPVARVGTRLVFDPEDVKLAREVLRLPAEVEIGGVL